MWQKKKNVISVINFLLFFTKNINFTKYFLHQWCVTITINNGNGILGNVVTEARDSYIQAFPDNQVKAFNDVKSNYKTQTSNWRELDRVHK